MKPLSCIFLFLCCVIALFSSCKKGDDLENFDNDFYNNTITRVDTVYVYDDKKPNYVYPSSKIWCHGANNPKVAAEKSLKFEGLEFDINYSSSTGKMYVCHNLEDTSKSVILEEWFEALPDPTKNWYWVDLKNMSLSTADEIAEKIDSIAQNYGIKERIWVEYNEPYSLQIIKNHGFYTILTVENKNAQTYSEFVWTFFLRGKIETFKPSAIGCDHTMGYLLNQNFSDQEIFLWQSTGGYSDEYAAETRNLCNLPAVKVLLVDYDEPITY